MHKKVLLSILLIAVLLIGNAGSAFADENGPIEPLYPPPSAETGEMVDETPQLWFVEFASLPIAAGGSASAVQADKRAFRTNAGRAGLVYTERYSFDVLWNGMSIYAAPSEVNKLHTISGVTGVYPVEIIQMPETEVADPELFTALSMTGADVAQSELGYTGAGIRVAVMDTGIDYDHPDLGGCFGPGCRVAFGYDLVGDAFNADPSSPSYNPVPVPDNDPDDCQGHGTHVSGIIGASGSVTGVAPGVTFGAYRVFGCEGSTTADIMIAAMEMAHRDHMDVLNMSIGSGYQWPQYPTAQAASRLVDRGMVVVASIGNNGANGLYSAGAPGLGANVIGVAAFDNTHVYLPYFEVNETPIGYVTMTYSGPVPTSGSAEIEYVGLACTPLAVDLTGKVALAARGTCSFAIKAINAINAGAIAVVIHNSSPGVFNGTLGAPIDGVTPVVGISLADGLFIRAQVAPVTMTWTDQMVSAASPNGGLISSFSSYGLSPDLAVKPDIGAPGGNIYSTYPLEKGGYATMGGTSMSSPHVAGAVALYLQAHPGVDAEDVRAILQNSADPRDWWGNPGLGFLDNVHRQGAGMLDIDDAILATTFVTPGVIAAGEGEAGPFTQTLTLTNTGPASVTYDLSSVNAISTGGVITASFYLSDAWVEFGATSVTVPAGGSATVNATIYPATGPTYGQYGGYIVFTPQGGGQVYRVPFAGFVGDYQGIQVLIPTVYGFPWLATLDGGSYYNEPAGATYTMTDGDIPYLLIHFEHQSRLLRIQIVNAATGRPVHPVFSTAIFEEYMPRNSTSTGFFAFAWDGSRIHSNGYNGRGYTRNLTKPVPDGTYYLIVNVLKANGDESNPAHWETWTSPPITIDRP